MWDADRFESAVRKKWKEVTDEWPDGNCGCGVPGWGMPYDIFLSLTIWSLHLANPCKCCKRARGGGKIRPVAKTGNAVNRKMNYLSEVLERGLHGSRLSTLFAGEAGNERIDKPILYCIF